MGLLDWITDGGGSLWNDAAKQPFVNATSGYGGPGGAPDAGMPPPAHPPMPPGAPPEQPPMPPGQPRLNFQRPEFDPNRMPPPPMNMNAERLNAPPPMPPNAAPMMATEPMDAGGPPPGLPPPPMPQARPAGAPPMPPGAIPPPPPEVPPGAPPNIGPSPSYPGMAVAQPSAIPPGTPFSSPGASPGDAGLLGSAFGMNPHDAMMVRGSLGAGLKAAGESAGKSPFQALTSGAGSALEGGDKASQTNHKQTIDYLNAAIKAKAAGDNDAYNTNYLKFQVSQAQEKLKLEKEKLASGTKGNTPEKLYLDAVNATNRNPALNALRDQVRTAGSPPEKAAAQAALEAKHAEILNGHLGRLKLDPQTAAQIGQQPGMSKVNPIDAGKLGIDEKNISEKLQPGQFYRNPKDGKIYTYDPNKKKGAKDKRVDEASAKPSTRAAAPDTSDTTDQEGPA